jgi:mono/diheme cytochrome c family protein
MKRQILVGMAGLLAAGAASSLVVSAPRPQTVREGKEQALELCSYCHVVAPDQLVAPTLSEPTPSFVAIANDPKTNAVSLQRFVTTTHWDSRTFPMTMPRPFLLQEQTDRIVSYILSLRSGPPAPAPPARSQSERRLDTGEFVALQLCSYCHVVSPDTRYRPELEPAAPSFQSLADNPKNTAAILAHFVTTTHWNETGPMKMPNQSLSGEETQAVVAYILSKRVPPSK